MNHIVKIIEIHDVTHNVRSFRFEKPAGYIFTPGQATDVSINKNGWEEKQRHFTFTSLNEYPYLEFTIKRYSDHNGVTNQIHQLKVGDGLIIRDVWGAIAYKGPGYFIAGGAGITPFIAILRQLYKENRINGNKLFFANKTSGDIIYETELRNMLGDNFINILSEEKTYANTKPNINFGHIDTDFLEKNVSDFSKHFYVCGPDPMISAINSILTKQGATPDNLVFEK